MGAVMNALGVLLVACIVVLTPAPAHTSTPREFFNPDARADTSQIEDGR